MRVASIALICVAALTACQKSSTASAQTAPQPQEVQWNQNAAPAAAAQPAQVLLPTAQVAVNGSNVTAQLTNVRPNTELTLAWFGPDGWNEVDQSQVVSGNSVSFAIPKFATPGRHEAELLNGSELLGTVDVNG